MRWHRHTRKSVEFDEILLDVTNLPAFNTARLEGRRELPIKTRSIYIVGILFFLIAGIFFTKIYLLQVVHGKKYQIISNHNTLSKSVIIAERGVVKDRNGEPLIWNEHDFSNRYDFPVRAYTDRLGLGQLLGYVSYPLRDKRGFYYRTEYVGRTGIESAFDSLLRGTNGQKIVEVDAHHNVAGEHVVSTAVPGGELKLSIDAGLSEAMYQIIATATDEAHFRSGAGAIMDIKTGELLAMTSFPSYDPEVMADGHDVKTIESYNNDKRFPFLNKVISGVYAPGSIVKPFMAYATLKEGIITPDTHIFSNGILTIPNPYTPSLPTHFRDWRYQGDMTVQTALSYSSDVFFYIIGGGLPQIAIPQAGLDHPFKGLGINKMDQYFDFFNFGHPTGIDLASEQTGTVPSPQWKEDVFHKSWLLGDTYHTAIGQFGWQVSPLQMLVAYGALANNGRFFIPHVIQGEEPEYVDKSLDQSALKVVHEGMRLTVTGARGTALSLARKDVAIAAKSGTAQLGFNNNHVNSWVAGFWPYQNPQYVFILMMDRAPATNRLGATTIMNRVFDWIAKNRPQYLSATTTNQQ